MVSTQDIVLKAKDLIELLDKATDEYLPYEIAKLIKNYSRWSIVLGIAIGWIPFIGYITAIFISAFFIWSLYSSINSKLNIPFIKNAILSIILGMSVNLIVAIIIGFFIELIIVFIPGVNILGDMAITAVICYYTIWTSGFLYLKALEKVFKR